MKNILFCFIIIFSSFSWSQTEVCLGADLYRTPILAEGRIKPLITHATEFRKKVLSKSSCSKISDVSLYCLLSLGERKLIEEKNNCKVELKSEHDRIKKILGTSEMTVSPDLAVEKDHLLREEYRSLEMQGLQESGYGVALAKLITSIDFLKNVEMGNDWQILVNSSGNEKKWALVSSIQDKSSIANSIALLSEIEKSRIEWEVIYEKVKPFLLASFVCLIAFLFALVSVRFEKLLLWSYLSSVAILCFDMFGMFLRTMISGRAPVTNMFETVMWAGFGSLLLGLLIAWKKKEQKVLIISLGFNLITHFMLNFSTTMLDSSIRPLVPVLRDNFWLSTHVTTITLSYSCFALAWVLANVYLVMSLFRRINKADLNNWNHIIRISIQVGSVLLAAGIILGGVWADYSWGRFWGWDPKETWSLIALIIYMSILHGKYAGWFRDLNFTMVSAFGFMSILMAWFGVNYILASGLHSYGFSTGGALFLVSVFATQMLLLFVVWLKEKISSNALST